MAKSKRILAYLLRVNENTLEQYQGYYAEVENSLSAEQFYVNYGRPHGLIQVISLGEIDVICHDEGKILGFPLNRAWVGDNGKILDIFSGNIMCVRHDAEGNFTSIRETDKEYIEKHLAPVLGIMGRIVMLKQLSELPEWKGEE